MRLVIGCRDWNRSSSWYLAVKTVDCRSCCCCCWSHWNCFCGRARRVDCLCWKARAMPLVDSPLVSLPLSCCWLWSPWSMCSPLGQHCLLLLSFFWLYSFWLLASKATRTRCCLASLDSETDHSLWIRSLACYCWLECATACLVRYSARLCVGISGWMAMITNSSKIKQM